MLVKIGKKHSIRRLRELYAMVWGLPIRKMYLNAYGMSILNEKDNKKIHETPPDKVGYKLDELRFGESQQPNPHTCNTYGCIIGWAGVYPKFNAEGFFFRTIQKGFHALVKEHGDEDVVFRGFERFFLEGLKTDYELELRAEKLLNDNIAITVSGVFGSNDEFFTDQDGPDKYNALRRIRVLLLLQGEITEKRNEALHRLEKRLAKKEGVKASTIKRWGPIRSKAHDIADDEHEY